MKPLRSAAAVALVVATAISGCMMTVHGDDAVSHQFGKDYFGAGGTVNFTETVEGDAFLGGGQVRTAGDVGGDLVAAAGELSVGGRVGDNLYAAAGDVQVDAMVHGNARVAGGDVTVGPATVIAGSATLTGGRIDFEGNAHGYLQASGGTVTITGQVHQDVDVRAQELVLGPETQIGGRLIYHGPAAPAVPKGAVIGGGVEFHEEPAGTYLHHRVWPMPHSVHWVGSLLWLIGVFLAGTLLLIVFPELSSQAVESIGRNPLRALGLGLAVLVCMPVVMVMLCLTIIGIPLALLLVPVYMLALFLGWLVAALFVGQRGLSAVRPAQPVTTGWRLLALAIALIVLALVRRIPHVGHLIALIVLLAGTGALVWTIWARRTSGSAAAG